MPWSGMKSSVWFGATIGCVDMDFMIRRSKFVANPDPLRLMEYSSLYGRHRPADRCAAQAGCETVIPEHRPPRLAVRAGRQTARGPARGGRRHPRLHGPRGPRPLRLEHPRARVVVLRGPD